MTKKTDSEKGKDYYRRNRDANREKMKRYYAKERAIVVSRLGGKCVCCGETEPLFLTVDHANNDGFMQRNERAADYSRICAWLIRNNFPDGFQLLCMNCNQGKHRNGGICPHQKGSTTRSEDRSLKRGQAPDPQFNLFGEKT